MPLNSLLKDMDQAVITWLDASCALVNLDGSNIAPYYSSYQRWKYQYDPSTNVIMDYGRVRTLPAVFIRRQAPNFTQERYRHPNAKLFIQYQNDEVDPSAKQVFWVPAPVPIDVPYEITVVSNFITEHNSITEKILQAFSTGEIYLNLNGFVQHMRFDDHSDDSTAYDLDEERIFSSVIRTTLRGNLVDVSNQTSHVGNITSFDIEVSNAKKGMTVDEAYQAWLDTL